MKIYVVGSSKNKFLPLDNIREKFLIDQPHEGDNIDFLNPWYCELTGLYYLWKHVDDEIVGLEHYRRYFVNSKNKLLSESEIKKLLKTNDAICCKGQLAKYNNNNLNISGLLEHVRKEDIFAFMATLDIKLCDFFKKWLFNTKKKYPYNMIICRKEILNEYCNIIFNNKTFLDIKKYTEKNLRFYGYIAEFFLSAFLEYKEIKVQKNNIAFIG